MIWQLTRSQYIDKSVKFFRKEGNYPFEIQRLLKGSGIRDAEKYFQQPAEEHVRELASMLHKLAVFFASRNGEYIPDDVMDDYPLLRGRLSLPATTYEYSFQKTDFKSSEHFRSFLETFDISLNHQICKNFPLMAGLECFLWQGKNMTMVTTENPLQENGFSNFLLLQGDRTKIDKAIGYIEGIIDSQGEEATYYVDFKELDCSDPQDAQGLQDLDDDKNKVPDVSDLIAFGEFLSRYPISENEVKGGESDADFNLYVLPWEMTLSEFESHVKRYTNRFKDYPIEVWDVLGHVVRLWPEMQKVLSEKPNDQLAAELSWRVHRTHVIKALLTGKHVPARVLEDYPGVAQVTSDITPANLDSYWYYGFDATDFKSSENFRELLHLAGLNEKFKVCSYKNAPEKPDVYLWEGEDVKMVTASNPLESNGHASSIMITGKKDKVVLILSRIQEMTGSQGNVEKGFISLKEIFCLDPDSSAPSSSDPVSPEAPDGPGKEIKIEHGKSTPKLISDDNWFKLYPDKIIDETKDLPQVTKEDSSSVSGLKISEPGEGEQVPKNASDYIDRVVAHMHNKYAKGERATQKQIETLAHQLNVPNMGRMWEAVELSWLLWYKNLYREPGPFEVRLSKMIRFWDAVQPTYAYSDSSKELYKQYSTPCPIAAIVSEYTGMRNAKSVFEPSAGNGLFVLGADPKRTHVNEIDATRADSLRFQGFSSITSFNAAMPFQEDMMRKYDVVVTNPPFIKWEEEQFDKDYLVRKYFDNHVGLSHHLRLEHLMAGLAFHTMKDNGKSAIIIMGHIYFHENGYLGKYRPFFNWLYRHYHVDDVINLNSFKLYNKQGAVERTMLILVNGRKSKPQGVAPNREQAPELEKIVNTFEELWARVESHLPGELDIIINQLKIALAA